MQKIKFAIAGYGFIGKRHAEMITRHPEAEWVAVCDILPKDKLGLEISDVPFFNSLDDLLSSGIACDVVTICTPNGLHAPLSLKALEAGKHIVCEKPMSLAKADCEKMIFRGLQAHKSIFIVMQNRYSPPSVWIKKVIDDKILGNIFMVQLNCYWNRDDRYYLPGQPADGKARWKGTRDLDGGALFTQFSHFIDIMYWLFGDIRDIRSDFNCFTHKHSTEFDDSGMVHFHFINGGMGCINFSTSVWDRNLESSITIIGKNGSIKLGGQYMDKVEYCHVKNYVMPELPPTNPANDYGTHKGSAANHHFVIENVVDTLKGRTTITTNALEGMKVIEIIERIYAAGRK